MLEALLHYMQLIVVGIFFVCRKYRQPLLLASACVAIYQLLMVGRSTTRHLLRLPFLGYAGTYVIATLLALFAPRLQLGQSPLLLVIQCALAAQMLFFAGCLDGLTTQTKNSLIKGWAIRAALAFVILIWLTNQKMLQPLTTNTAPPIAYTVVVFAALIPALITALSRLYVNGAKPTISRQSLTALIVCTALLLSPILFLLLFPVAKGAYFFVLSATAIVDPQTLDMPPYQVIPSTLIIAVLGHAIKTAPSGRRKA